MGKIHAATRVTPRLKRVLSFLRLRGNRGATTREIVIEADACAVNTTVYELRTLGYVIDCDMETRGRFRYRLLEEAQRELFTA